mmetsp:Transcript_37710/g.70568  ORF Transcript_37710/g.70568 Transcript_37710/m.70568 type:complete len:520 (+) Transcript_37710:81-1640(+)
MHDQDCIDDCQVDVVQLLQISASLQDSWAPNAHLIVTPQDLETDVWLSRLLVLLGTGVLVFLVLLITARTASSKEGPAESMLDASPSEDQAALSESSSESVLGGIPRASLTLGLLGATLEWYDFGLYGFFAVNIGHVFFPSDDQVASLAASFAMFGGAFVARPLGGILFGHIGDRFGRVTALRLSLGVMVFSTTMIGLVPPARTIGRVATISIFCLRILQGLSAGGQGPGAAVYLMERTKPNRRCFISSLIACSSNVGTMLSSAVGAAVHPITASHHWCWRLPFVLAAPVAILGGWASWSAEESEEYVSASSSGELEERPLLEAVRQNWIQILQIIGLIVSLTSIFYVNFVWMPTYLHDLREPRCAPAFALNTVGLFAMCFLQPFWGWVADRGSYEIMMALSLAMGSVFGLTVFVQMATAESPVVLACYLLEAIPTSVVAALMTVWMFERVPNVSLRYATMGIAIGTGSALGAGPAPFVATKLLQTPWGLFADGFCVSCSSFLGLSVVVVTSMQKHLAK